MIKEVILAHFLLGRTFNSAGAAPHMNQRELSRSNVGTGEQDPTSVTCNINGTIMHIVYKNTEAYPSFLVEIETQRCTVDKLPERHVAPLL